MLTPFIVLSVLSVVGGVLQLPFSKSTHFLEHWLHPVIKDSEVSINGTWAYDNKWLLIAVAVVIAAVGIFRCPLWCIQRRRSIPIEPKFLEEGWYYDAAVSSFVGGPGKAAFSACQTSTQKSSTVP
jgi:NADH-quinone oxidoreductase subunit L